MSGLLSGLSGCVEDTPYTVLVGRCAAERDVRVRTLDEAMRIAEASPVPPVIEVCPSDPPDTPWSSVTLGALRSGSLTLRSALPEPAVLSGLFQTTFPREIVLSDLHTRCGEVDIAAKTLSLSRIERDAPAEGCVDVLTGEGVPPGGLSLYGEHLSLTEVALAGPTLGLYSPQLTVSDAELVSESPVQIEGYYDTGVVGLDDVTLTLVDASPGAYTLDLEQVGRITAVATTLDPPALRFEGEVWYIPEGVDSWSCDRENGADTCPGLERTPTSP